MSPKISHRWKEIKAQTRIIKTVLPRHLASNASPTNPAVLSTTALISLMETASAEALTEPLINSHCLISVPARMSIDHLSPAGAGTTLCATAQFQGADSADSNTLEFLVLVHTYHEPNTLIAKGTFWRTITCQVNLESTAYLTGIDRCHTHSSSPPVNDEAESVFRSYIQRKTVSMSCSNSKTDTRACNLCCPFPKRSWSGAAEPAHDPISRGFLHAVHHGSSRLVELWLTSGVDLPRVVLDSALYTAVCSRRASILERLIHGARADPLTWSSAHISKPNLIFTALDMDAIGPLKKDDYAHPLVSGADETDGTTAGIIRVLLCAGVDPNAVESDTYWTGLHLAVRNGDVASISVLLEFGADPNRTDDEGWTPLHIAVQDGDVEAVVVLLAGGADGESRTDKGDTPVMLGVRLRREMAVRTLLDLGCKAGLGPGTVSAWDWLAGAPVSDLEGYGYGRELRP